MKLPFYLIVSNKGAVRTTKTKPGLSWNEISIKMNLELPDAIFNKPALSADITVKDKNVAPSIITTEVKNNIEDAIRQHTGIEVKLNIINEEENPA